jgi:hypothetical protein
VLADLDASHWAEVVTAVFTIFIAGGVVFAGLQVLDGRKTRSAEIVRELTALWDSPRMIEARRLIGSFENEDAMIAAFSQSKANQTGTYFLLTYHLNFWEQVGMAYGSVRGTLKLVDVVFGDLLWEAWAYWRPVLEAQYGEDHWVGRKFRTTFEKLQKKARRKLRRRELRLLLFTPYYNVPLEQRRARRQAWKLHRSQ